MWILIVVVAVIAVLLLIVGAMAGADPEGRGGSCLFACWCAAALLAIVDVVLLTFRWLLS
jgi:hypothetical protein